MYNNCMKGKLLLSSRKGYMNERTARQPCETCLNGCPDCPARSGAKDYTDNTQYTRRDSLHTDSAQYACHAKYLTAIHVH